MSISTTLAEKIIHKTTGGMGEPAAAERATAGEKALLDAVLCVAKVYAVTGSMASIERYCAAMYPTLTGSETLPELIEIAEAAGVDATGSKADLVARLGAL